jgi:hypothetical protein
MLRNRNARILLAIASPLKHTKTDGFAGQVGGFTRIDEISAEPGEKKTT